MNVTPVQKNLISLRKVLANPHAADFAQNTVCAIAVETTLKAAGRPAFIYYDKHANEQSKKYAATKELLYQTFCLGLFLGFIKPVKNKVYKAMTNWQRKTLKTKGRLIYTTHSKTKLKKLQTRHKKGI